MKKIILLMLIILLAIPLVSAAWEWDNVKSYDEETKTITIINAFNLPLIGNDLATVTLNTPQHLYVIRGEDRKIAEFTINNYDTYDNVFNDMGFYNIKRDMKKFDREFIYKYKNSLGLFDVNDYKTICEDKTSFNGTKYQECYKKLTGTHQEERFEWVKLDISKGLPEGEITIGIFTDVYANEKIEWIPTLFGVKIKEFAIWEEYMDIGLTNYYNFDEEDTSGSGVIIDALDSANGTNVGAYNATGKIKYGYDFRNTSAYIDLGFLDFLNQDAYSISFWVYLNDLSGGNLFSETNTTDDTPLRQISTTVTTGIIYVFFRADDSDIILNTATGNLNADQWYHFVFVNDNGGYTLFLNGSNVTAGSYSQENIITTTTDIGALARIPTAAGCNATIDEVGLWNISLNESQVSDLWNNGDGITYSPLTPPTSTLNAPDDLATVTNPNVIFNATGVDNSALANLSLIVNGSYITTNSSVLNGVLTQFPYTLPSASYYNWTVEACDDEDTCVNATLRGLTYSNDLNISLDSPVEMYNSSSQTIIFNGTPVDDTAVINVSIIVNGSYNGTNTSGFNDTLVEFTRVLADGFYNWTMEVCDAYDCLNATTRNLTIDSTFPLVNITYPITTIDYHLVNTNETLNWTATNNNLDTCWYDYNFTNVTVTCNVNTTTFTLTSQRNITFWANDTFEHYNSDYQEWDYKVFENSQTFNNETIEGVTETFIANITLGSGESLTGVSLDYNGTSRSATQVNLNGNLFNLTSTFTIPAVTTDTNISFFWIVNLVSGQVNTTSNNQTVKNIGIDNCTTHSTVIFNYTMIDEESQTQLPNTTLKLDISIFNLDKSVSVINFSTSYNNTNPAAVCLSINLTNETIYALDSTAKYEAINYSIEYYNIQNFQLDNSSIPQEINLFDLLTEDSTEFQITFKDSNFVTVEDALIQINRQYVSEGLFKTVEIPKTDSNGQTVVHLVEKDIVYNIVVLKEGVILGTFNNIIAFCEDALIGSCFITLNALEAGDVVFDYDEEIGLLSSFEYNETSRILQFDFSTTDAGVKNVSLSSIKFDQLGNTSVCDSYLVSSSGSLYCTVPASIGNETIIVKIFVDGDLKITNYLSAGTEFDIGDAGYFLMFFLVLSLALMMTQSKIGVIIGVVLGFISASMLSLFRGGVIGMGSSIVWLIIMAIILIWKLNSQRQT